MNVSSEPCGVAKDTIINMTAEIGETTVILEETRTILREVMARMFGKELSDEVPPSDDSIYSGLVLNRKLASMNREIATEIINLMG